MPAKPLELKARVEGPAVMALGGIWRAFLMVSGPPMES